MNFFHKDLFEMAAAHLFHLAQNRGFEDGSSSAVFYAALWFPAWNDVVADAIDPQMIDLVLKAASGKMDEMEIAGFLRKHQIEA